MIVIIDYGMGNLQSVAKALEFLGEEVIISREVLDLEKAERIILPGVGSFKEGMNNLLEMDLIPTLENEVLKKKKPFLGICLGMQLLAECGEENGFTKGLGWIPFKVKKFDFSNENINVDEYDLLRIPHMGWNEVNFSQNLTLFKDINNSSCFYFVHSYHLVHSEDKKENNNISSMMIIANCNYGYTFPAAIQRDNIFATQFHPEKSQKIGLKVLQNFLAWGKERLSEKC